MGTSRSRSFFQRIRTLFGRPSREELLGEVLVNRGLITKQQLQRTIEAQREALFERGQAVPLGRLVVDRGYTSEEQVIATVNEHYDLSVSSLSDNIKELVRKLRDTLPGGISPLRIPIWLQLAVATLCLLAVSITMFGVVILERQKEKLYDQSIKLGMVSLTYLANNAKIPLLNDDTLELNTLINDAAMVEGHFYAFIVDADGVIKAHTDPAKLDKPFEPFSHVDELYTKGNVSYFDYSIPGKAHILNLSMPITFSDKYLGEAHVGLSVDFVNELFLSERAYLAGLILVTLVFGIIVSVLFGLRFSRPISRLVAATSHIAGGDYSHRVRIARKDEFGTLGRAFNNMAEKLDRQSLMRETFGKYVGTEVLDMIMKHPEKGWLKGRRNHVSVLFADIRGFTAYSETREPEEVVEQLNEFFTIASETVMKHGGYVDKFIGDSVLAVFGVPVYRKDHAERCLAAALDMQEAFGRQAHAGNALLRAVGIGLASGVAVAGNIGSPIKTEYTVIGDCVNVASYINSLAGPGEIIVANGMGREFGHLVRVEPLEPRNIKGKEEKVEIFRIIGSSRPN